MCLTEASGWEVSASSGVVLECNSRLTNLTLSQTLALLLPLILLLVTFLFLLVLLAVFLLILRRKRGIVLRDETGPTDVGTEHTALLTAEGGLEGVERRWLEEQDEDTRRSYQRAKGESDWFSAEVGRTDRPRPGAARPGLG